MLSHHCLHKLYEARTRGLLPKKHFDQIKGKFFRARFFGEKIAVLKAVRPSSGVCTRASGPVPKQPSKQASFLSVSLRHFFKASQEIDNNINTDERCPGKQLARGETKLLQCHPLLTDAIYSGTRAVTTYSYTNQGVRIVASPQQPPAYIRTSLGALTAYRNANPRLG